MALDPDAAFRAVIDNPGNAYCRILYARSIARTEHERSRYIRWSLRKTKPAASHESYIRQVIAFMNVVERIHREWNVALKQFPLRQIGTGNGFVEFVRMDAADFLQHAAELYRCAPILSVRLDNVKPVCRELLASPHLSRLRSLDLRSNNLDDEDVRLLTESPHLQQLRYLYLSHNNITRAGLELLCAAENMPNVTSLSLWSNPDPALNPGMDTDEMLVTGSWYESFIEHMLQKYGDRAWLITPPDKIKLAQYFV